MTWIEDKAGAVVLTIRVAPRASKDEIAGLHGDALKVRLCAPPVEGKANEALVRFLAKTLDIPARSVELVSGATGRNKLVRIHGLSAVAVKERLLA